MDISCDGNSTTTPRYTSNKLGAAAMDMTAGYAEEKSVTVIEQGYLRVNAYVNASFYVK
jgi:hypothetical protein